MCRLYLLPTVCHTAKAAAAASASRVDGREIRDPPWLSTSAISKHATCQKTELQIAVSPAVPTPAIGHMSGPRTQPIVDPPEPATTAHGAPRDAYAWPLVGAIHFVHPKTPAEKRWPTSSRASRS